MLNTVLPPTICACAKSFLISVSDSQSAFRLSDTQFISATEILNGRRSISNVMHKPEGLRQGAVGHDPSSAFTASSALGAAGFRTDGLE